MHPMWQCFIRSRERILKVILSRESIPQNTLQTSFSARANKKNARFKAARYTISGRRSFFIASPPYIVLLYILFQKTSDLTSPMNRHMSRHITFCSHFLVLSVLYHADGNRRKYICRSGVFSYFNFTFAFKYFEMRLYFIINPIKSVSHIKSND